MAAGHTVFSHASHSPAYNGTTPNVAQHALRNASLKIAGVILLLSIILLILLSAQADGRKANDLFNSAGQTSQSGTSTNLAAGVNAQADTSSNGGSSGNTKGASTSLNVNSSTTNDGTSTSVTVNGQPVDVPDNGNYSQTYTNPDGSTTTVNVNTSSNGGANNFSSTNTDVNTFSNSFSSSNDSSSTLNFGSGTGGTN